MLLYLHIPKTGGTAIRNALRELVYKQGLKPPFDIIASHDATVYNLNHTLLFSIRDPLERFCSGYWERFTNPLRFELNKSADILYQGGGYSPLTVVETELFKNYKTPNELITSIREKTFDNKKFNFQKTELNMMLAPLTAWLGQPNIYKANEHKIKGVFNIKHLSDLMYDIYGLTLSSDPFIRRSRDQYDFVQDYAVDQENTEWFKSVFRRTDYQLVEYIKTRHYYFDC